MGKEKVFLTDGWNGGKTSEEEVPVPVPGRVGAGEVECFNGKVEEARLSAFSHQVPVPVCLPTEEEVFKFLPTCAAAKAPMF